MQFVIKRDILLKSLNFVQGVVEKKILYQFCQNVLLQLKDKKLSIIATDLDIIFYDELSDIKVISEGSTTTSAAILYDILRKIPSNSELNFELKSENKLSLKVKMQILICVYLQIIFLLSQTNLKAKRFHLTTIDF